MGESRAGQFRRVAATVHTRGIDAMSGFEERAALAIADLVRHALRHERKLGDDSVRVLAVRLQQSATGAAARTATVIRADHVAAMLTSVLDQDLKARQAIELGEARGALDGPNADLLRKRYSPSLLRMWAKGRILDAHLRAAAEIRQAFELASTPDIRGSAELQERVDMSFSPARLEGVMADDQVARRVRRWLDKLGTERAEPVLAILVLERPFKDTERQFTMRNGTVGLLVRDALEAYCRLAGWGAAHKPY